MSDWDKRARAAVSKISAKYPTFKGVEPDKTPGCDCAYCRGMCHQKVACQNGHFGARYWNEKMKRWICRGCVRDRMRKHRRKFSDSQRNHQLGDEPSLIVA